jgi:hypothetical protein
MKEMSFSIQASTNLSLGVELKDELGNENKSDERFREVIWFKSLKSIARISFNPEN